MEGEDWTDILPVVTSFLEGKKKDRMVQVIQPDEERQDKNKGI